jgi:hypothetical protein
MVSTNAGATIGEVVTRDSGDHRVGQAHLLDRGGDAAGSPASSGQRLARVDEAEPARRVQRSPLIMNVAVPSFQHS